MRRGLGGPQGGALHPCLAAGGAAALDLEVQLVGELGLTPPPADSFWRERRRDEEVDWRRQALRRLRWQTQLTWCLRWLFRALTLGPMRRG